MKKTNILGLSLVSILALAACGGGGGNTASSPSIETGVGYYKDAAVIGADYDCGASKGKTEAEGKFLFEKGQSCIFSLGGVKLREVPAADLVEEETIFEDNLAVAKFLQAIDKDGNPENGIVLDEEVVKALVSALEDANKTAELPIGAELDAVVAHIDNEVENFTGRVRTEFEVQEHLDVTETDLSKALFSGKTFYAYYLDDNGKQQITEVIVSEDASSWNYTELVGGSGNGYENITFKKDTISIEHAGEQELDTYSVDKKDTYLALKKGEKEELKFFYKKADAEALLTNETRQTEVTKALLSDKTFYVVGSNDGSIEFMKSSVNKDVTKFITYKSDGTIDGEDGIKIVGNKMTFTENTDGSYTLISQKNGYVFGEDHHADGSLDGIGHRLYALQSDAQAYYDSVKGDEILTKFSKEWLDGKTLYYVQNDDFGHNEQMGWNVAKMTFNSDGSMVWNEIATIDSGAVNTTYRVNANGHLFLLADQTEGNGEYSFTSQTSDYLKVCEINDNDCNTYFFFDRQKALDFKSQHNNESSKDMSSLIVGKTIYQHTKERSTGEVTITELTFQTDGKIKLVNDGYSELITYRISENTLYTTEDGQEEAHTLLEHTDKYVKFNDGGSETSTFYFTRADAEAAPVQEIGEDGGNENQSINNLVSGHVDFKDKDSVPSDAWVGITPLRYQNNASGWNRLTCKLENNGDYGNECYIGHNEQGMRNAFTDSSEKFQILVFKNHVESSRHHWNCGEDLYAYKGGNEEHGSWSNITVRDINYQDRSNEKCGE